MSRALTLKQAQQQYPHRYTMDHKPKWAEVPAPDGKFYAPQYRSDVEWYQRTDFPGEDGNPFNDRSCYSTAPSWPLGQWLDEPFTVTKGA